MTVRIRTPQNQRIIVNWNVQAFANACSAETGATNFGTYLGHSPSAQRATDAFSTIPMPRSNRVVGDAIAEFALRPDIWRRFGIRYIIWRQRINWNDGRGWRLMENRGGDVQNHFDHDHIAFNVIPSPTTPIPTPTTSGGRDVLIVNVKDTGIFLMRGEAVTHLHTPDDVFEWVRAGVPYQDRAEVSRRLFSASTGWEAPRGARGADDGEAMPYDELVAAVQASAAEVYDEYVRSMQVEE